LEAAAGYRAFRPGESATLPDAETQPAPENEAVRSTAAAWASWRQIRDGGNAAEVPQRSEEFDAAEPVNAAAVAAGAEQALPSPANSEQTTNHTDVASIVDSVLADLRPKLMQEISRKMAEKK
jgi:hypothetical protein